MNERTAYIVGAGSMDDRDLGFKKEEGDLLIAADAGFLRLRDAGLSPDLLIADFDSMDEPETNAEIIRLPIVKDDTDTVYAVREAVRRGYRRIVLLGCLGGTRLSHSVSNLQTLLYAADLGAKAVLRFGGTSASVLFQGESVSVTKEEADTVSLFAVSEEAFVTLKGFQYPLENGRLSRRFPLGVSNHLVAEKAEIRVEKGELLLITEQTGGTLFS